MFVQSYSKDFVVQTLRSNQVQHIADFEKAWKRYRHVCMGQLAERLDAIKADKPFQMYFNLPVPQNHSADYTRIITMLEKSVDDTVELDEKMYENYIEDNWRWKQEFTTTNTFYNS